MNKNLNFSQNIFPPDIIYDEDSIEIPSIVEEDPPNYNVLLAGIPDIFLTDPEIHHGLVEASSDFDEATVENLQRLSEEIVNFPHDEQNPVFILVRHINQFDKTVKYEAIKFSIAAWNSLMEMIRNPTRAWEVYQNNREDIGSDIVAALFDVNDSDRDRAIRQAPEVSQITHIGFFSSIYGVTEKWKKSHLKRIFETFPTTIGQRIGRFINYKLDKEALEQSNSDIAKWLKELPKEEKESWSEKFQIPWFKEDLNLEEGSEGNDPITNEIYSIPCLLYALKGQVDNETYKKIADQQIIYGDVVKTHQFSDILKEQGYGLKSYRKTETANGVKVRYDESKYKAMDPNKQVKLMYWEGHWMKYDTVIKNKRQICFLYILEKLKEEKIIKPLNAYEFAMIYKNFSYDQLLNFNDKLFINSNKTRDFNLEEYEIQEYKNKQYCKTIYFADFESSTDEKYHIPYLCCCKGVMVSEVNNKLKYEDIFCQKSFRGRNCGYDFLNALYVKHSSSSKNNKPIVKVYFHNLHYDFTFLLPYLRKVERVMKGNKLYSATGLFKPDGKSEYMKIDFWDSLPIFQCSLKSATESYLTEEQKKTIRKEAFPYSLYTYKFFEDHPNNLCSLDEFIGGFVDFKALALFNNSLDTLDEKIYNRQNKTINYMLYAEFYCNQDVNCLYQIMINFADLLYGNELEGINGQPPFKLVLWKYRTASSIGYDYFRQTVLYKKDGLSWIPRFNWVCSKTSLRALIQKTIRGGRVMVRDNGKFIYNSTDTSNYIQDYDGVSLYPSAMSLLWVSSGVPKFVKNEIPEDEKSFLNLFANPEETDSEKYSDGCIHLTFLNTKRKLHFPLLCIKDKKTGLNNYKNFENEEVDTWVNAIDLFNLIDFQDAEFKWDAAVVWSGKRDLEIRESIKKLFTFRLHNKKHPIQLVTKLMMNSIFGKSILKPNDKEKRIIDRKGFRKNALREWEQVDMWKEFYTANCYRINRFELLEDDDKIEVELLKRDVSSSFNIFGSNVLAMARRIIGRVISVGELCEEENPEMCPGIFYTDTDSMHIRNDLLLKLEEKFQLLYGKPIRGTELTQFHVDFDSPKNFDKDETVVGADQSIFIMKKMYANRLIGSKGHIGYHMRMKGVPSDLVHYEQYFQIYNGESVVFDLLNGHTSFFYEKGHVGSRLEMTREIMTRETREKRKRIESDLKIIEKFNKKLKKSNSIL